MWKAFEAGKAVVGIINQLVTEFGMTRSEASVELMEFIYFCEKNNLLVY
jgi:hypothetical protein